jgi:hypothetical protein
MAWQLGGKKAYARIQADDEKATNPGDALRELLNEHGPALILIDEWVAYARQLHDRSDLPGGDFETQFSFAQALTESVKLAGNCLLVVSLPASDTAQSPHTQAEDIEVGGQRGREALERLRNVVGRLESSWRPATAEEGFEIVRRRLFEPMTDPDQYKFRDVVARAFYDSYRTQQQEFPQECRDADYEQRLRAAYPIHPEVFDRLYSDWSTLAKFQRTRGVLRLMAAVIHSLWEGGDRNPLILPCHMPIDDTRVQFELTRYLSDNWVPVIEKDVDGPNALPLSVDAQVPNLGRYSASRRVARTIYLGSAPMVGAANLGLEDRRVKLGCAMPGESPAIFGDALRRLSSVATYLYQDGARYWYSTQPTVTKLAEDRAEQLKREPEKVAEEIAQRVKDSTRQTGEFSRVHPLPRTSAEVVDDLDARLVILSPEFPHSKEPDSLALAEARKILETRGTSPRLYRNALVFLAADKTRLQDLDVAVRKYLAWVSIVRDHESLDLSPHQLRQAEAQRNHADSVVVERLPETYQWLLVPVQASPQESVTWQASPLSGSDPLAVRASKKLMREELLMKAFAPTRLRMELDRVPLWRGNHVGIRLLAEDFAKYLYLPRLKNTQLLMNAIQDGLKLLTWSQDSFAFADLYDVDAGRYRGLVCGQMVVVQADVSSGLVVKPEVAMAQLQEEAPGPGPAPGVPTPGGGTGGDQEPEPELPRQLTRFFGSVRLDPARVGRDAGRIADEVISHLSGLVGADVTVTLEVQARVPQGVTDEVVRIVTENARTLKFESQGFEGE